MQVEVAEVFVRKMAAIGERQEKAAIERGPRPLAAALGMCIQSAPDEMVKVDNGDAKNDIVIGRG